MKSKTPITRQVAWISLIPQLIIMAILMGIASLFISDISLAAMCGALTYLIISKTVRYILLKDQNKGMSFIKKADYQSAIPYFESSYNFFTEHLWVDQYRYLTVLSSSAISFREMALCNIAFCYVQMGDLEKGKEFYTRTLKEFPDSTIANTAIKYFRADP